MRFTTSIPIDCLLPLCFDSPTVSPHSVTFCYYKQQSMGARAHTHAALTDMNARLVHRNQGLLGLNRNVMVSRNLYWSTLSALIAWLDQDGDQRDAIGFERSPSKSCPQAILPPQLSNTSTPACRKVTRMRSVPLYLHLPAP